LTKFGVNVILESQLYFTFAPYNTIPGEVCRGFWWGNLRERDHWVDPDVDRRIILRWIFRKWEGVVGTGQVAGTCEYGEEPSGSKNAGHFLTSCRTS
jgi:hypothetical protein